MKRAGPLDDTYETLGPVLPASSRLFSLMQTANREKLKALKQLMRAGYKLIDDDEHLLAGCDRWLEAWEGAGQKDDQLRYAKRG